MKAAAIKFPGVKPALVRKNPQIPFRLVMYYLKRYLKEDPRRFKLLRATYETTTGEKLGRTTLWRHTAMRTEPTASAFLIYLGFLLREKAIAFGPGPEFFTFTFPELAKAKPSSDA